MDQLIALKLDSLDDFTGPIFTENAQIYQDMVNPKDYRNPV
jgi:hypothetical protein